MSNNQNFNGSHHSDDEANKKAVLHEAIALARDIEADATAVAQRLADCATNAYAHYAEATRELLREIAKSATEVADATRTANRLGNGLDWWSVDKETKDLRDSRVRNVWDAVGVSNRLAKRLASNTTNAASNGNQSVNFCYLCHGCATEAASVVDAIRRIIALETSLWEVTPDDAIALAKSVEKNACGLARFFADAKGHDWFATSAPLDSSQTFQDPAQYAAFFSQVTRVASAVTTITMLNEDPRSEARDDDWLRDMLDGIDFPEWLV